MDENNLSDSSIFQNVNRETSTLLVEDDHLQSDLDGIMFPPKHPPEHPACTEDANIENLKCHECKRVFTLKSSLVRHKKKYCHTNLKQRPDENIEDHMKSKDKYYHIKSKLKKYFHSCEVCGKGFLSSLYLKRHMQGEHNIHMKSKDFRLVHCMDCNSKLKIKTLWGIECGEIDYHFRRHMEAFVRCDQCNKSVRKSQLYQHMKDHIDPDIYSCDQCSFISNRKQDLKNHVEGCNKKWKRHECKFCFNLFLHKRGLRSHIKRGRCAQMPDKDKPKPMMKKPKPHSFNCKICDAKFSTKNLLNRHEDGHKNMDLNISFPCLLCDKVFWTSRALYQHMRYHEVRKYTCDLCQKKFATRDSIRMHLLSHLNLGVKCEFCKRTFKSPVHLSNHQKQRCLNPRKYQCDLCGKFLASQSSADEHRRIHTGERPYTCTKCGASFRTYPSLKRHDSDVHQGNKNYRCDMCDTSFSQNSTLQRHINDVHKKIKAHKCEACGWRFAQKSGLKSHQARCEVKNHQAS